MSQGQLFADLEENAPPSVDLDEQYTPSYFFAPLMQEFQFTLDPTATAESTKCPRFFTKEQDGFKQSWRGERVWFNPPYSNIGHWLRKVKKEMAGGCQLVVALLPAWPDRKWWHEYVEPGRLKDTLELRFVKGRVIFGCPGNPEGKGRGGGKFPSVLVIWRAAGLVIPDPRQLDWVQDGARGRLAQKGRPRKVPRHGR